MSVNRRQFTNGFIAALAAAAAFAGIAPAVASKPVPKTIVGCVFNGGFVSSDGYDIRPMYADWKEVDLRPFEGHQVTISGDLLPGDAFIVKKPLVDSGPCKTAKPGGPDSNVAPATDALKVATAGWQIHKPSKEYKDLPVLLPKQQESGIEAGIGLLEFVCMKSNYYVLLVQPSVKLRDTEPATISARTANMAGAPAPAQLTFRNLYKTKSPCSSKAKMSALSKVEMSVSAPFWEFGGCRFDGHGGDEQARAEPS